MGKLTAKSVATDLLQSNFCRSTSIWSQQTFCSKSRVPEPSVSKALQSATLISCLAYKSTGFTEKGLEISEEICSSEVCLAGF